MKALLPTKANPFATSRAIPRLAVPIDTSARLALAAAALLTLGPPAAAQQDFDAVEIETSDLGGGIHMLVGEGGNIGVSAGQDGVFVVDDQFAPLTEKILAAIGELSDEPPTYVVNTHWHFDHTGGNENMGEAGAVIVAHENVRTRMSTDQFIEAFQREVPASPEIALPVVTFSNDVTFHYNGTEIRVMHRPAAHTDGDAVVMFVEPNVVHTGDLFFNRLFPFIDGSSGGSIEGMIAATESLLGMVDEETRIIPGHGPLATRGDLEAYRDMLVEVRDAVQSEIDAGKDREAVLAAAPLAGLEERWGRGFLDAETFTGLVHDLLAEE